MKREASASPAGCATAPTAASKRCCKARRMLSKRCCAGRAVVHEARGEKLAHDARTIGLLHRAAVAPAKIATHGKPRALARAPADELQALKPSVGAGELGARDGKGLEDLGK